MPKVRWDLRIEEDLAEWAEEYALLRGGSRTMVVELALGELRGLGVPEVVEGPVYRSAAVRRCFVCPKDECVTRVFLGPADPVDFVPECHGPMVRDENRPYLGRPTPV